MDRDPAFGAGAVDVLDVDPVLLGLAQRRLGGVVLRRSALTPALAQLSGFVGGREAEVFGLVAGGCADFLSDDLGDLLGDPTAGAALLAVAAVAGAAVAATTSH